eukprot:scaffold15599_cov129-Skeletonema_dohrnii-CCMP3373.AAC.10
MAFLMCSAGTVSLAISCAMQHHFLNPTSINTPRYFFQAMSHPLLLFYLVVQIDLPEIDRQVSFTFDCVRTTRNTSPCLQGLSIQLYMMLQSTTVSFNASSLPSSRRQEWALYRSPQHGSLSHIEKRRSNSTFHLNILPQMVQYSFTSPHLFPNDFQNGLRDVCLFAKLTMGKGGEKGSY